MVPMMVMVEIVMVVTMVMRMTVVASCFLRSTNSCIPGVALQLWDLCVQTAHFAFASGTIRLLCGGRTMPGFLLLIL